MFLLITVLLLAGSTSMDELPTATQLPGLASVVVQGVADEPACLEKCLAIMANGLLVGFGCVAGIDGDNCFATVSSCTIRLCGFGEDPEGDFVDFAVVAPDGTPMSMVTFCRAGNAVLSEERIGFTGERQWSALEFREGQLTVTN